MIPSGIPRRAVCTGGAGFIGSHVVEELLARGCEHILVLDDLSTGSRENLAQYQGGVEVADVAKPRGGYLIEGWDPDVIFHLAAQTDVQTSVRWPLVDAEVNVLGTLRILEAAERCGARVVFASTGGAIYGDCAGPASEETPPDPRSPYAVSKLAGEWYVRQRGGIVLRYANVYGRRQLATLEGGVVAVFLDALARCALATIFGDGGQTRDFVYVEDVARATVDAAVLGGGVYNVGTGRETSVLNLAGILGLRCEFEPERPGEVRRSVLDSSKLRAALGRWEPRALEDGLDVMRAVA